MEKIANFINEVLGKFNQYFLEFSKVVYISSKISQINEILKTISKDNSKLIIRLKALKPSIKDDQYVELIFQIFVLFNSVLKGLSEARKQLIIQTNKQDNFDTSVTRTSINDTTVIFQDVLSYYDRLILMNPSQEILQNSTKMILEKTKNIEIIIIIFKKYPVSSKLI